MCDLLFGHACVCGPVHACVCACMHACVCVYKHFSTNLVELPYKKVNELLQLPVTVNSSVILSLQQISWFLCQLEPIYQYNASQDLRHLV